MTFFSVFYLIEVLIRRRTFCINNAFMGRAKFTTLPHIKEYSEILGDSSILFLLYSSKDIHLKRSCSKFQLSLIYTKGRYARQHEVYFSIENTMKFLMPGRSKIQKCKDLPILSKLDCFCINLCEMQLV